ncbi:MAG: hypothetical protein LC623_05405 [Halobacteriales archaeon]|nr:hypothetical protein [Halobacteriales archaeon]
MRSDSCAPTYPSGIEPECFTHAVGDVACNLQVEQVLAVEPLLTDNAKAKMLRKFTSIDQEPQGIYGRTVARMHRWVA